MEGKGPTNRKERSFCCQAVAFSCLPFGRTTKPSSAAAHSALMCASSFNAARGRLRARVVDADKTLEFHLCSSFTPILASDPSNGLNTG